MTEVRFYEPSFVPDSVLTYAVIPAKFCGKWIFVRHHERTTWEIAGGHIEKDETPDEAARRELMEETGATNFNLECIATYSVTINDRILWGRLYLAEVKELGEIPDISEIAEMILSRNFPEENTHPLIQPLLFKKALEYLEKRAGDRT
jgi:8-oxo-dGTP diphosphatase